jgi:16S rRNA (uracil1498-N3)-methyltransferase
MAESESRAGSGAHRFFIAADAMHGDEVRLAGVQARQICRVLRLRPGATIRVFHGTESEYLVTLDQVAPEEVRGRVAWQWIPDTEPGCRVWLAIPLLKAEKLEWVVQKGVELGACGFLLTQTQRTVVRTEAGESGTRLERLRRIATEATEQCGRMVVPPVEGPVSWSAAIARAVAAEMAAIAHNPSARLLAGLLTAAPNVRSSFLLTGPEGGFTPDEIAGAERAGVLPVSLGRRTLRAETAAIAGLTLMVATLDG